VLSSQLAAEKMSARAGGLCTRADIFTATKLLLSVFARNLGQSPRTACNS
jgi:hypothetical protein